MRTFANKQPTNQDSTHQKRVRTIPKPIVRFPLLQSIPLLQRKLNCACGGGCPRCQKEELLQTKLKISKPRDEYEQEADRIADEVMRMPEPSVQQQLEPKAEEELQRQPMQEEEEEKGTLQTLTTSGKAPTISSSLQNRIASLRGSGQPLSQSELAFFEPRFGNDFSQVRVHADSQAAETAQALNARAFTLGQDIVFGAGQYQPSASEGRLLLAHELTHVMQQTSNIQSSSESITMNSLGNLAKRNADVVATELWGDGQVKVPYGNTPTQLQRVAIPSPRTPQSRLFGTTAPAGSPSCPTTVRIGQVAQFNHSNLSAANQQQFRTYLGAVSRMDVGPGSDHSGHCMKEQLTTVLNTCPAAVYTRGGRTSQPCTGNRCLDINRYGSAGDSRTHTMLSDGPTSFIDLHRTFNRDSLLEGTGVSSCSVVCEQIYKCDRTTPTTGKFLIIRNFQASTFTPPGGTPVHITTGTVTKTQELMPGEKGDFPLRTLPEGLEYA